MTGAVFIDLSKAFDNLDHASLLSKLSIYGIKNRDLSWFSSYLFDRKLFPIKKRMAKCPRILYRQSGVNS